VGAAPHHRKGHDDTGGDNGYPDDDEDMEEAGEEYEDIVEVPFEQVSYSID
jgi:hypothetical protein